LEGWNEYTEYLPAHPNFKKWAGIFLVSAGLTRRVWVQPAPSLPFIFPNLWLMLVGKPGTGKDMAINQVVEILDAANQGCESGLGFYLGEESLSSKGFVDSLASDEARCTLKFVNGSKKEETTHFHSLIGCIPELGTFMSEYNTQLVSIMNDLYNCRKHFRDRIRGGINKGNRVEITNPHVSFLFGTQPETLASIFPEQAFKMGFFSRTVLIYGDHPVKQDLYATRQTDKNLLQKLISDIRNLPYITGPLEVTKETQRAINHFHTVESDETALSHSRFEDYNIRRTFHLQKLAIVYSIAESPEKIIRLHHWEQAKETLFEAEKDMFHTFANLVSSRGYHSSVEEITTGKGGKIITHRELERTLRRRHPPYEVGHIIKSMLGSRDLVEAGADQFGLPTYKVMRDYD
jgi:hypothetical protein